jgi:glucose/arabinose dehydrogenase
MRRITAIAAALAGAAVLAFTGAAALAQEEEQVGAAEAAPPPGPPPFQGTELAAGPWDFSTQQGDIHVEVVARGLDRPWGLAFLPDGGMLVTERSGQLRLVSADGELDPEPITGLPQIYAIGIAGLMDIALHPEFASNRLIYLSYSKPDPEQPQNATLAVLQARWDGGPALADVKDVFVADAWYGAPPVPAKCCGQGPAFGSFGGRILFGRDGKLFVTSGDRNFGEMVQDTSNHFGKILRLNADGTAPRDNPWVGREGHKPEVWSTGHRNPLGLTIDPATGSMWESEFGPRGGDEVNRIERGSNYGWILVTQGNHYDGTPAGGVKDVAGYEDPVMAFGPPSLNPGNLAVYRGARFRQWDGDLLLASFTQGLLRFDVDGEGRLGEPEQLLQDLGQRWRDVRVGPDGDVWMLTDQDDGALIRISPR